MATRWARRALEHLLNALLVFNLTTMWKIQSEILSPGGQPPSNDHHSQPFSGPATTKQGPSRHSTTFLLGIFCTMNDTASRQLIRETMLGPDLPAATRYRLCSLNSFLNNEAQAQTSCQIVYTFVVGGSPDGPNEYEEGAPLLVDPSLTMGEPDMTSLNILENMNRGKTPSWFHYASVALIDNGIDYVSKVDLDTLISIPQLLEFVREELPPRGAVPPRIYGGIVMDFESCGGRWWPSRCQPVKGKVYMSGQFYFLSYDLVRHQSIWRTNRTFKERKQEDMAFGIRVWSYPHPIKLIAFNPRFFWQHGLKNETLWNGVYSNGHYRGAWDVNASYIVNSLFKPPELVAVGL